MKTLGNVLYITSPEASLGLDGDAIVITKPDTPTKKFPLINLQGIVCFNYLGVSPALMARCIQSQISLCFLTPNGRFQARVEGQVSGNVLLRKMQFLVSEDPRASLLIARNCIVGKIYNQRKILQRAVRDHPLLIEKNKFAQSIDALKALAQQSQNAQSSVELLALEGSSAKNYFSCFGQMIFQQKTDFAFTERNRRPPLDRINALLSFLYVLLTNEVSSALAGVGLDPYVGFFHSDRPGRVSLALDMMEELRPVLCDRVALNLVNRRQIDGKGFLIKESGGVLIEDETRKKVLTAWQEKKKEQIIHPFLKEKVPLGLIPHIQAQLLARYLRGDLDGYPPFLGS